MRNLVKCFPIIPLILLFQVVQAPAVTKDELKVRQLELWNEQDLLNQEISKLNKEVDRLGRANIYLKELLQGSGKIIRISYVGQRGNEWRGYYSISKPMEEEVANLLAAITGVAQKRFMSTAEAMRLISSVDEKLRQGIRLNDIPNIRVEMRLTLDKLTKLHHQLEKVGDELAKIEGQLDRGEGAEATAEAKITREELKVTREALDEFKIVSVDLPSQMESDAPKEDLTVSWTGGGKFPAKVVYRPKPGGCPKGFSCSSPTKEFGSDDKPVVLEDAVYCYGVREGSAYFNYEVVIIDATGKESAPVSAGVTCNPKK